MVEQATHLRVRPARLGELQRQAFRQRARGRPGRLAALHQGEGRRHLVARRPRRGGRPAPSRCANSRPVELLDDGRARAVSGARARICPIWAMRWCAGCDLRGEAGLEIRQIGLARRADAGAPSAAGGRRGRCRAGSRPPVSKVSSASVRPPRAGPGRRCRPRLGGRRVRPPARRSRRGRLLLAREQRVLLDLLLDEGGELEMRHLQQLDRLLQLRRHHQLLDWRRSRRRPCSCAGPSGRGARVRSGSSLPDRPCAHWHPQPLRPGSRS